MTVAPTGVDALELCVVIDAGRCDPSRIRSITTGWSEALSAVGDLNPFARPVSGSLMATATLAAGSLPFEHMPHDASGSAEAIAKHGQEIASQRESGRAAVDDPSMFASGLAQACAALCKEARSGRRRLIVVYRKGFSEAGSADERMVRQELASLSPSGLLVLLVGQRLSETPSRCVRMWSLPVEALRSPSTVAAHAWTVLEHFTGAWWDSRPRSPSARAGSRLVCDSCGSASEWQEVGEHCPVCHMGHMRAGARAS